MRLFTFFRSFAVLAFAVALNPGTASAQVGDTLSITGTFRMSALNDPVRPELAAVFANGNDHWWRLRMEGVTYSHERIFQPWENGGYSDLYYTKVHATSFVFEFFGPDSVALNGIVSSQLAMGSQTDGSFLYLLNWEYFDPEYPWDNGWYAEWGLGLLPLDGEEGLSFSASNWWHYPLFNVNDNSFPIIEPQRVSSPYSSIVDRPSLTGGSLASYDDIVDFVSELEPIRPPPPPPPVEIVIDDASALEGDRGTSVLQITVRLSRSSEQAVTVNYLTVNGSAVAKRDYIAASGSLIFQRGQTSLTIPITIKGDRQREANETFTVKLSGSIGANLSDSVGTATIVNDD